MRAHREAPADDPALEVSGGFPTKLYTRDGVETISDIISIKILQLTEPLSRLSESTQGSRARPPRI